MAALGEKGIDVSHYQGAVNWSSVASDGITFAMIKASEGEGHTDPMFTANWTGCKTMESLAAPITISCLQIVSSNNLIY